MKSVTPKEHIDIYPNVDIMSLVMSSILFLCTGNSCRSQMAEAWGRYLFPAGWEVYSAGIEKHGLNPLMLTVMSEVGIDMSQHFSKTIDELPEGIPWDLVVTVCDHATRVCPTYPESNLVHLPFDDPPSITKGWQKESALKVYRRVRDEIRTEIEKLVITLKINS